MTHILTIKHSGILAALASVFCQSLAFIFMKTASRELAGDLFCLRYIIVNFNIWMIVIFVVLQSYFWQITLRKMKLVHAYFYTLLIYPALLLFSIFIFGENISLNNVIGTMLITLGLVFNYRLQNE